MWDPYAGFEKTVLPNGLTVYVAHWPGRPISMEFLVHAGAQNDPAGLEGLAHFVEHLVSRNAIVPRNEMLEFFEEYGGGVDFGTTGYPYTYYKLFLPMDEAVITKALSMFGQMLLSCELKEFIENQRQVIISEFYEKNPDATRLSLSMREMNALYAGHWFGRALSPLGSLESINRITQDDLQVYYNTHYAPANMSIVAVGGISLSELVELILKSPFAINKGGYRTLMLAPEINSPMPTENIYVFEVLKNINVVANTGSYRSVVKVPGCIDRHVVQVFCGMLDKVLFREVRENRAWTYNASSSRYTIAPFHQLAIDCSGVDVRALDEIEEVINNCISSIASKDDLLEVIKRKLVASFNMMDITGRGVCGAARSDLALCDRIVSNAETIKCIESVSMNDINALIQWLKPERRWTLLVKP